MKTAGEHFHWGKLVVERAQFLLERQSLPVHFVDFEVLPPFEGSAEGIFVWFICARRAETVPFRARSLQSATTSLREALLTAGFPPAAASSLQSDVTSLEEIQAGGGRFAYFR